MKKRSAGIRLAAGAGLFLLCRLLLPGAGFTPQASLAVATAAVMVWWWVAQPVHPAVTAFLPVPVCALFAIAPMEEVLAEYFSPTVVLLLGANLLVLAWGRTGLSRRIALLTLRWVGTGVKTHIAVWFSVAVVMSAFLPNAVVAAALCPVAHAMLSFGARQGEPDVHGSRTSYLILLAIVWGAGLGGFGTPLGGAMNLVAIRHIEAFTGREYLYLTWTVHMLPYLLLLCAGTCAVLLLLPADRRAIPGNRTFCRARLAELGKMGRGEALALGLFCAAVLLAFARPLYQGLLPSFTPFYAFLLAGLLLFFLPGDDGEPLLRWEEAAGKLNWGMIFLFSGGMAAGNLLVSSGAADTAARLLSGDRAGGLLPVAALLTVLGLLLSNVSSNTAATAILIPIVLSVASARGVSPLPLVYLVSAACNCAFVLPTSIRAIPVGYGLDIRYMFRTGLAAAAVSLALLLGAAAVTVGLLTRA